MKRTSLKAHVCTFVSVGLNEAANYLILQTKSEDANDCVNLGGMNRLPGSRNVWPKTKHAALPLRSSLNMVLRDKMMEDRWNAQAAVFIFAVNAVLIDLIALSACPFEAGYLTLLDTMT